MINHTLNDNFEFSFMAACNRAVKNDKSHPECRF